MSDANERIAVLEAHVAELERRTSKSEEQLDRILSEIHEIKLQINTITTKMMLATGSGAGLVFGVVELFGRLFQT